MRFRLFKTKKDVCMSSNSALTLQADAYELFRVISYEYISETCQDVVNNGLSFGYIRLCSGLSDEKCQEGIDTLKAAGVVYEVKPGRYGITTLGVRTNLYQNEGKRVLDNLDKLMDELIEEQHPLYGLIRGIGKKTSGYSCCCTRRGDEK